MSDKRIIELDERSTLVNNDYIATDNTNGTAKVNGAILQQKADTAGLVLYGSTNTSGSTITAGTYFYLGGELVKAKTNIAANATFTLNTNYEKVSLGEELTSLNQALIQYNNNYRKQWTDASAFKAAISAAAADGNLKKHGLSIGDYCEDNGYRYTVAHLNPFYGGYNSYAIINTKHIGVLVQKLNYTTKWGDNTDSGYKGSTLHSYLKNTVLPTAKTFFGNRVLTHDILWTTALSYWGWSSSSDGVQGISALTESQINGAPIWSIDGYQQGEGCFQLEVFRRFNPSEIFGNIYVWSRSLYSASDACFWGSRGNAHAYGLSNAIGVVGLILVY